MKRPLLPPLLILLFFFFSTRVDGGLLAPVRKGDEGEDLPGLLQSGKEGTTALVVRWNAMPWALGMFGPYLDLAGYGDWSLKNDS